MKKYFVFIFSFSLLVFSFQAAIAAEEATDSSVTEKIKERLEKTAQEGLNAIKEELTSQAKSPKRKAYVGSLKSVNSNSLILEYKSQNYTVIINNNTDIVKSSGQKQLELTDLQVDDYLIALGFVYPDKIELEARKITVINAPQPPINHQLLFGQIEEIDGNKVTIDGKTLNLGAKTKLTIKDIDQPTVEDLELKDTLFAIVSIDKNGDIDQVKAVLVIPGKNNPAGMAPTNASESALPATDSATIE